MKHIKCSCGALFGIEQDDGTLQIKYRDMIRTIRNGQVNGACRRCGDDVSWAAPVWNPSQWVTPQITYNCNCACVMCLSGACCMNRQWTITTTTLDTTNEE